MTKSLQIQVYGRVQGVNFRNAAQSKAVSLGITGYVKNMPDGSVYIAAEGAEEQLNSFVKWCQKGPSFASVTDIGTEDVPVSGYDDFTIR